MNAPVNTHPAQETLISYGLGKLDETLASSVSKHLEGCAPCRQRVAELSSDSFLGRLREANPQPVEAPPRTKTLVENVPPSAPSGDARPRTAARPGSGCSLPAELVDHPQYEVIRELGRGGMGVVYLARNKLMDRLEVLKVLAKEMLAKEGRADRFLREIQSAAKLQHANVVAAYTAFPAGDLLVFAMEYVEGEDLAKLLRSRGPLPVLNACYFAYQAAQGLQHAHERGMIHRDIKPANLILLRQGKKATVKILDFGLAKVRSERPVDRTLTEAGQMLGTPDYIAPEQTLDAQKADIRADIYSLGCTLYHLLTGSPPFTGNSLYEVLQAHHSMDAKPLNLVRPEVPPELAAVVAKMLAKDLDRRYQTPAEVVQALKPFLKPGGLNSPPAEISQISPMNKPSAEPQAMNRDAEEDVASPSLAPMAAFEPAERWKSLLDLPAFERSSAIRKALGPAPRREIPWKWPAAAAGLLAALLGVLWACGVFSVKMRDGVIVLQNLPPDAEVFVDNEKVLLTLLKDGPAEITVPAGTHALQFKQGNVIARGQQVVIANGGREVIDAEFKPAPAASPLQSAAKLEPSKKPSAPIAQDEPPQPAAPPLLVAPFEKVAAKEGQENWAQHLKAERETTNTVGMKLVLVPPGRFEMGSHETMDQLRQTFAIEAGSSNFGGYGEWPVHAITITKPFFLGKFEVTKREFRKFVDEEGYRTSAEKDGRGGTGFDIGGDAPVSKSAQNYSWRDWGPPQSDDSPVVNVTYNDAVEFCAWLSRKEGKRYRLPTEAEWEYACRAGTTTRYYNGDDPEGLTKIGNVRDETWVNTLKKDEGQTRAHSSDGYAFPAPVGSFQPNNFGLYDMIGNAWEYCADWYNEDYYRHAPERDPSGPATGDMRVQRGGSWAAGGLRCRASERTAIASDQRMWNSGFRVALSVADRELSGGPPVADPQQPPPGKPNASSPSADFVAGAGGAAGGSEIRPSNVRADSSPDFGFGPASKEKFVRLFNGADFDGWTFPKGNQEKWSVENGVLRGDNWAYIATARSDFTDFHLRMRVRTSDQVNKHLIFRSRDLDGIDASYRFHLGGIRWDQKSTWPLGSYSVITRTLERGEREPTDGLVTLDSVNVPFLDDKWHQVEVIAIKNVFRMILDGRQVSAFRDPLSRIPDGRIMFALVNGAHLELRDIEINETPATIPTARSGSGE